MKKKILFPIAAYLPLALPLFCQDAEFPPGVKRAGGSYANLFKFEFKPGKTKAGLEILNTNLISAFKDRC